MSYDTLYFVAYFALFYSLWSLGVWRGALLLATSIGFYLAAGWRDSTIAAVILLFNYAASFAVARDRRWLAPIVGADLGCLAYFKYRAFLSGQVPGFDLFSEQIVIPLGISFYIFQLIAYQVDLASGQAPLIRSLPRFALFKLYFAQLVAGPITRAKQLAPQIALIFDGRIRLCRLAGIGLGLCLLGLVKKIVIADSLAPFADAIFRLGPADAHTAWLGVWLFGFQIYYDFSGYSDIALGLALLCGIRLPVNFRQPYLAPTPQAFWRHWHITLSTWIRDYLYIPLGGSQGGWARQALVLFTVMGLAGLWHGANWTFIVWGLGWAAAILLWRHAGGFFARLGAGQWLLTLVIAFVLWVFFRAPDLPAALRYIGTMFGLGAAGTGGFPDDGAGGALILLGALALLALQSAERLLFSRRATFWLLRHDGPVLRGLFVGLALWLVILPKVSNVPFIYFRF